MKLLRIENKESGRYLKKYELVYENKAGNEKHYEIVSHHEITKPEDLGTMTSGISMVVIKDGCMLLLKEFRMGVNRKNRLVILEAEGEFSDHTSANEKIQAAFYNKKECEELLRTAEFSSRCQAMVYFFAKNAFDMLDK